MRVVAKDEAAIKRLYNIMGYRDSEYYLYRVFSVGKDETEKDDDLFFADFFGDVAWDCSPWFYDEPDMTRKLDTGAHYSNLLEICADLNVGVEVFAEEEGIGFRQHFRVDHYGKIDISESVDWSCEYNEDGEVISQTGGLEDYMDWSYFHEIYGE
jgi:hypothetical protein